MGFETKDHFECDRCGARATMPQGEQRKRWGRVLVWTPPKMNPAELDNNHPAETDKVLCGECKSEVLAEIRLTPKRLEDDSVAAPTKVEDGTPDPGPAEDFAD